MPEEVAKEEHDLLVYKFICRHPFPATSKVTGKVQTSTSEDSSDYSLLQDAGFRYSCKA